MTNDRRAAAHQDNAAAPRQISSDFSQFTYPHLLRLQASVRPDAPAIVTPARAMTWRQLDEEAGRLGAALLSLGVAQADKVGILMPNCCEWAAWAYGAAGIGAVVVPANTRFREEELAYQLKASDTRVLVLRKRLGDADFLGMILKLVPELKTAKPGTWASTTFPQLKHVICVDAAPGEITGVMTPEDALRLVAPERIEQMRRAQDGVRPQDVAIIQYTSGTTAFPKGVMLSHYSTTRNAFHVNERLRIGADDRIYSPGPFFHVGGSTLGMLLGLLSGAPVYTQPKFDPPSVLDTIEREKITVYNGVDSLFITLMKHPAFRREALSSITKGWIASSPDLIRMVHREMGLVGITNVFGISEASPNVTICDLTDPPELRAETCGYPHADSEVKIVHPDTGVELPAGERGEICYRGYSLMLGYYKNPAATEKAIDSNGWLHTGDRGLLRPTGELEYFGRIKDMLRVGGENLAPAEVEEVLCQYPKVRQAAVIGLPDERLVEVPAAVLELKPGEKCTTEEIVDFCKLKLAAYKIPRTVAFVDALPMTGSGKIQKFRLRQDVFGLAGDRT